MAALARYGDRPGLGAAAVALLGVAATACGAAYAIALFVAPAPTALRVRHLAAGAAAAWVAHGLAGAATRMGLGDTTDAFRVLWAPVCEEACKALLLAAIWSRGDDRRDRL